MYTRIDSEDLWSMSVDSERRGREKEEEEGEENEEDEEEVD